MNADDRARLLAVALAHGPRAGDPHETRWRGHTCLCSGRFGPGASAVGLGDGDGNGRGEDANNGAGTISRAVALWPRAGDPQMKRFGL